MATKQSEVPTEVVKELRRVDSSCLTLESCANQLEALSTSVLELQNRYDSLRDVVVDKLGEDQIEEGFVFVEPQQPVSGQMISSDLQKLTHYIQERVKCESTLLVGDHSYRCIKLPEGGLKLMRECDIIPQPTTCQDFNIEDVLHKNMELVEENKSLQDNTGRLMDKVIRLEELLRKNQLADAMGEEPEGSITSSLFGEEVSSNISALKEENKQMKDLVEEREAEIKVLQQQVEELRVQKEALSELLAAVKVSDDKDEEERSIEATMTEEHSDLEKERKALQDEIDQLRAELIGSKEKVATLQSEVEAFRVQADTYRQDFERERADKEEARTIISELERGWRR
jgi:hypothetical protein